MNYYGEIFLDFLVYSKGIRFFNYMVREINQNKGNGLKIMIYLNYGVMVKLDILL
jgi:hypothetical protein